MTTQINSVHFTADQKLLDYVLNKLEKLNRVNNLIANVEVYLKLETQKKKVNDKTVELKISSARKNFFFKETALKFENAFDACLDVAKRKLRQQKEQLKA